MLTISEQQLETLDNYQSNNFQEIIYSEIKQRLTPDDLSHVSNDQLRECINYAIENASNYNITEEKDVIRYAFLVAILGTNFHQNPNNDWIVAILESPPPANVRLDQLANVIHTS